MSQLVALAGGIFLVGGCGAGTIPNTDVRDTARNRNVIEFLEKYRNAVERQDVSTLLRLASEDYLDDNGTPVGNDDISYDKLEERLQAWSEKVMEVRYEIRYRRITRRRGRILVDLTYTASFRVKTVEGSRWARRLADNRLVLVQPKDMGTYRILSGM